MKKRILSILLVAVMVIPMFVMPTAVSAAVSNDYSFKFEETDARNAVSGQVFDVAADGEADTAPEMDGTIEPGEYQVSGTFGIASTKGANDPSATLPVKFAVKDGYLYVAFTYKNEEQQMNIQYDIGVSASERSDGAWSRKQATWKSDDTTGDHSWLIKMPGSTTWAAWSNALDTDLFLVDKCWDSGIYEAKFDLREYYRLFANSVVAEGVYETPCVTVAIWYAADNTEGNHDGDESTPNTLKYPDLPGQTHYGFAVSNLQINSAVKTQWVPATVIIPDESLALIAQDKRAISATVGGDYVNGLPGQLLNNGRVYSDVLPTVDGTVNPGEYSASQEYTGSTYTTDGKFNFSYSVGKDGLVYCALTYKEATHSKMLVQPGLAVNNGVILQSRTGVQLNPNGSRGNQNSLFKDASNASGWFNHWGALSDNNTRADASAASTHADGMTTYEFTLSLPMMIHTLETAGWSAYNATGIYFYFFFGPNNTQYKMSTLSDQETALRSKFGFGLTLGYFSPMVSLPTDFYERFKIDSLDTLEDYFASGYQADTLDRLDAAPSDVVLDGKIGAGEYTAVQEWDKTDARAQDSQFAPGISYDISGKNFVAYDDEYLYFGAEVYDNNFVPGRSYFQLNLGYMDNTKPLDIGHTVRRMNVALTWSGDVLSAGNYGGVLRSQECNATKKDGAGNAYIGQSAWLAGFNTKKPEVAGSYDAKTKTVTYEAKVKLADLEAAFDVENIDKIYFMSLAQYVDPSDDATHYAWNFFKDTTDRAMDILYTWTAENCDEINGSSLYYDANMYGHIINLNREFATREGASVRISTKNAGIRFKTTYTDAYLAEMQAYADELGEDMVIGTLIAPADYIDGEFTHEALGAGRYVEVINVRQDLPYRNVNGVTTYAGSLVNIKDGNLDRDFAGRGFVKVGDEYFYSDTYAIENVSDIATAALEDTKAVADDEYKYPYNGEFSCYGEAVRNVLSKLVASK